MLRCNANAAAAHATRNGASAGIMTMLAEADGEEQARALRRHYAPIARAPRPDAISGFRRRAVRAACRDTRD